MARFQIGQCITHEQARSWIGPEPSDTIEIDEAQVEGCLWEVRRVRLDQILDLKQKPYPPDSVVEDVRTNPGGGLYDYEDLLEAMRSRTPMLPIAVRPWANLFILIDGAHRLVAARVLGRKTILAVVRVPPLNSV